MEIRDATPDDALAGCTVFKRSIAELCEADHWNDPAILARWLGNKTPENFTGWVEQADNSVLVAVENGVIRAVFVGSAAHFCALSKRGPPNAAMHGAGSPARKRLAASICRTATSRMERL
jgi:hypothetical protein